MIVIKLIKVFVLKKASDQRECVFKGEISSFQEKL
jgi:hypothetical protein